MHQLMWCTRAPILLQNCKKPTNPEMDSIELEDSA